MTNITKAAKQALAELADWHWSQAATLRKAACTSAMDKPEPGQSSLTRMAGWHDTQKSILRAALQGKAVEVPADGWLQGGGLLYRLTDERRPQNRDEINVTMADGSRSPESRARRAGELLDRIRSAQPAPVVPDDVARYQAIRNGLVYIEPYESGEIYVAGETGVYTKSGDEFDAAIDAIAASKQKG